jgi:hypothetical protein
MDAMQIRSSTTVKPDWFFTGSPFVGWVGRMDRWLPVDQTDGEASPPSGVEEGIPGGHVALATTNGVAQGWELEAQDGGGQDDQEGMLHGFLLSGAGCAWTVGDGVAWVSVSYQSPNLARSPGTTPGQAMPAGSWGSWRRRRGRMRPWHR